MKKVIECILNSKKFSIRNTSNQSAKKMSSKILRLDRLNINQTKLLNEISFEVRKAFDDYITRISLQHTGNLDWLVSAPASRDLYLSDLYRNFCDLYLIKRLLACGENYDLIIVKSFAFKTVLKKYFKQHKYKIRIICRTGILKSIFITVKRFISLLIHTLIRCFIVGKKTFQFKITEKIILLDCFILKSSIKANKYYDRYYPGLLDFLDNEERKKFYYLPEYALDFYDSIITFRKIRKLDGNYLIKDDFLKFNDYLYALFYLFRVTHIKIAKSHIDEFELQPLVKYELKYQSVSMSSYNALLNYRFAKRLRERNVEVQKLINWNENQVVDKGLVFGFHKFYPHVKILGYRGYTISDHYIHVFPTSFEKSNGVVPDTIAVTGKALIEPLKELCSDLRVVSAPAFRFSHLWQERKRKPDPEHFTVLIALPLSLKGSCHILKLVTRVLNNFDEKMIFFVKSHPVNTQQGIQKLLGKTWPGKFQFVSGDFYSVVECSNLVISNNSCVCVETIAKGIPVIVIAPESDFAKNPIPMGIDEKMWKIVYTEPELLEAIFHFRAELENTETPYVYKKISEEIRDKYFEPVTQETMRHFLATE